MAARAPRRPRRPPPRARRAARPRASRAATGAAAFAALLALVLLGAALYALNATFQPFHGDGEGAVAVDGARGRRRRAHRHAARRARASWTPRTFFQVNATVTGRRGKLRPGNYTLLQGMSNGAALDALVKGPKAKVVKTVNVTVPEGLSIREAAPVVDKGPLEGPT